MQYSQRILQIGKYSLGSYGGIETVTRLLHCNGSGLAVESLTFQQGSTETLPEERSISPLCTISKQPISFRYVCELIRLLRAHRNVVIHLPNVLAAFIVYLFAGKKNLTVFWHADILQNKWHSTFVKLLEKKICQRSRSIIYTSKSYYEASYSKPWVGKDKVCVIPLGVPPPTFYKSKYRSRHDTLKLLFVGRNTEYKGLAGLVEEVRSKKNVDLTIVGIDASDVSKFMTDSANIHVAGVLSTDKKQRLIADHDFLVLPSTSKAEAFGLVLIEALSAGTPIITRRIVGSGMGEVSAPLEGRPVGYSFDDSGRESLSKVLDAASNMCASEYRKMSEAAREKYLKNYTASGFTSSFVAQLRDGIQENL